MSLSTLHMGPMRLIVWKTLHSIARGNIMCSAKQHFTLLLRSRPLPAQLGLHLSAAFTNELGLASRPWFCLRQALACPGNFSVPLGTVTWPETRGLFPSFLPLKVRCEPSITTTEICFPRLPEILPFESRSFGVKGPGQT